MAKKPKSLDDLFHETLKDIFYAENKLSKALPKMAKAAKSPELKKAFDKHATETKGQIERLNKVFSIIGKKPQGKTCPAINGLIEEGQEVMKDFKTSPAHDAGLLSAAQAVEHYEISRYGTLKVWAEKLGHRDAAALLNETLGQEKKTDEALTELSDALNDQAEA
jgi:ferritin-like metal-binding protein YciE